MSGARTKYRGTAEAPKREWVGRLLKKFDLHEMLLVMMAIIGIAVALEVLGI